jgi:hypothetical protein
MATIHKASEGSIKIAGTTVAEVKSISIEQKHAPINTSNLASTADTFVAGRTSWSGSCDCFWSSDDSGQLAITIGAKVALIFYPTSGKSFTGDVFVDSITIDNSSDDMISASFAFTGTGGLTIA